MDIFGIKTNWFIIFLLQCNTLLTEAVSPPMYRPTFCNGNGCPLYNVVRRYGQLELRCYKASMWISMQGRGVLYSDIQQLPTWRLHRYFKGYNHLRSEVPVGMPVVRFFDESTNMFSYDYFIPNSFRGMIPQPNDSNIKVIYRKEFCAYVYTFKGWLSTIRSLRNYKKKSLSLLKKENLCDRVYSDFYFYVAYGSLWKKSGQYNEIWLIIKFDNDSRNQ